MSPTAPGWLHLRPRYAVSIASSMLSSGLFALDAAPATALRLHQQLLVHGGLAVSENKRRADQDRNRPNRGRRPTRREIVNFMRSL